MFAGGFLQVSYHFHVPMFVPILFKLHLNPATGSTHNSPHVTKNTRTTPAQPTAQPIAQHLFLTQTVSRTI